jgi:predicted nucleotidyltransferase
MRIDPKDTLAGQSILKIRDFLRRNQLHNWGEETVGYAFAVDSKTAKRIIILLKRRGYIEPIQISGEKYWKNTIQGNALALSSAAKPISRATAEKKLKEFLERVVEVRISKYYLYKVTKVVVFGSYLTAKEKLNDIDISISLAPKEKNVEKMRKLAERRINEAFSQGKVFSNFVEQISWPQHEVIKFLKGRSRSIGLHQDEGVLKQCEHKVIYTDE